jgi:hypothetical protein
MASAVAYKIVDAERQVRGVFLVLDNRNDVNVVAIDWVVCIQRHVRRDELHLPDFKILHTDGPAHYFFPLPKNCAILRSIANSSGSAGRRLMRISK